MQSECKIGAIMYDGCVLEVLVVLVMIQSRGLHSPSLTF